MMMEDRFLKRLRKKARKGLRGWPIATIAFYGPNLSQATKVTVGIVPSENAEVEELRDWKVDYGDIRADPGIAWRTRTSSPWLLNAVASRTKLPPEGLGGGAPGSRWRQTAAPKQNALNKTRTLPVATI
jgi:hypothetical protein